MIDDPNGAHDTWEELAAAHALHALEPADEQRFQEHLATCAQCIAAVNDFTFVAAQLGSLADNEPDQPPSWQRIRSGITDTSTVTPLAQRRSRRVPRWLSAAAAAIVLTAGGITAWQLTGASTSSPRPTASALSSCQQRPACQVLRLHTPQGSSPAALLVSGNRVAVVPLTMPAAPAGHSYVLWQLLRDGGPIPVTEFGMTDRPTATVPLPSQYADTAAFAISIENGNSPPSRPTHVIAAGPAT